MQTGNVSLQVGSAVSTQAVGVEIKEQNWPFQSGHNLYSRANTYAALYARHPCKHFIDTNSFTRTVLQMRKIRHIHWKCWDLNLCPEPCLLSGRWEVALPLARVGPVELLSEFGTGHIRYGLKKGLSSDSPHPLNGRPPS